MTKFKTEQDVINYFSSHDKGTEIDEQFKFGARWSIQMNEEYIAHLLKRISSLQAKTNEQSEKLSEYECLYFGAEPPAIKKSRKKTKSTSQEEEEREEFLSEMESIYGPNEDFDEDFDEDEFFRFED